MLKKAGHVVDLFDATFFLGWTDNENEFNTLNGQYKPSPYDEAVVFSETDVTLALQQKLNQFKPDIIFFSAISSHIHGEGEYVSIQLGAELISKVSHSATVVCGGLQSTADPLGTSQRYEQIDILIGGESEQVLVDLMDYLNDCESSEPPRGVLYLRAQEYFNPLNRQEIIQNLDVMAPYDYSLFDDQVFLRPYNGEVVRAVDFEISRGCMFTCNYCVETVIQGYYGFDQRTNRGALKTPKKYLRSKSAQVAFEEFKVLHVDYGVELFRMQDTNFLTIDRSFLLELAEAMRAASLNIKLYIETRPEGINEKTVELLKDLRVDGVGMGIELSTQDFREESLNRFADQERIIKAFQILKKNKIRGTAYNVIGFPGQDEASILQTIEFNKLLQPDNVTVAFYSPFIGTVEQRKSVESDLFDEYESFVDPQLRTLSKSSKLSKETLEYYKENFVRLAMER